MELLVLQPVHDWLLGKTQSSVQKALKPPPLHSPDSVMDKFVLDSSTAYAKRAAAVARAKIKDPERQNLFDYFLKRLQDPNRYSRYLRRRGEDAQKLLDSIQDLLDSGFVDEQFRVILIVALTRLVANSELYPRRFILDDVTRLEGPLLRGKSGFIGKGMHRGELVCIKALRLNPDINTRSQALLLREITPWRQLQHPNLLPFYGLCRLPNGLGFISAYLVNGNVIDFLQKNPDSDRLSLVIGLVAGMSYLHDMGLVHGGIKGRNVLVTDTIPPQVCLADYGHTAVAIEPMNFSFLVPTQGGEKQFLAPEILGPTMTPRRRNEASDVYAFSMTFFQILTGHAPFMDKSDYQVIRMVLDGKRPTRPTEQLICGRGLSNDVWQIMEDCWKHDSALRPNAHQIMERLLKEKEEQTRKREERLEKEKLEKELDMRRAEVTALLAQIFNDVKYYKCLLSSNADDSQMLLDSFQLLLDTEQCTSQDRVQLIAAMRRLSERTKLYPLRFLLQGSVPLIEDDPIASGNYADIYKVTFQDESTCFKVIRVYQRSLVEHMAKVYAREVIVWGQLSHPNILPFYGLSKFRSRISFVSPWAENGHLSDYLARNPGANRILLCFDTASGIDYLHRNDIVHGDLKGVNVLVEGSGRACLGDFGLSSVTDPDIIHWTSQSSMASHGGTARWQAPELHETEDKVDTIHNSKKSDVFAWANLCYEIFTGRLPYFEATRESTVIMTILRGGIPTRPEDDDPAWSERGLNDRIWDLLEDCWKFEPSERPDMSAVISTLGVDKPHDSRPPPEWERRASTRFRNAQDTKLRENMLPLLEELHCVLSRIVQEHGGS